MDQKLINTYNDLKNIPKGSPKELFQQRGRDFEALINDVFDAEGVLLHRSYHTSDNRAEQIDAAIEVYHRVFLVEVKWVESNMAASELFAFIGKTDNKFHGTLGVFISKEELSDNFINALSKGRRQSIIVIHGDDLEQLFQVNAPQFKDYLEYCFKRLSYDNATHFPVKKYLPIFAVQQTAPQAVTNTGMKALVDQLNGNVRINQADMLLHCATLPKDVINSTFSFIESNYREIYFRAILDKRHQAAENINEFIRLAEADNATMIDLAKRYFLQQLPSDFGFFGGPLLLQKFSPFYKSISNNDKVRFEEILVKKYHEEFDNWDVENKLTEVVVAIWDLLSDKTRQDLYPYYLQFYLSDSRKDKFSQKQYAYHLLNNGIISVDFINKWLDDQIEKAKIAYEGQLSDEAKIRVAVTYHALNNYLKIEDWKSYIFEKLS